MQRTITRTLHLRFCAPFSHVLRVSRNFLIASVFPFTFCWTSHSGRPVFAFFFLSLSLFTLTGKESESKVGPREPVRSTWLLGASAVWFWNRQSRGCAKNNIKNRSPRPLSVGVRVLFEKVKPNECVSSDRKSATCRYLLGIISLAADARLSQDNNETPIARRREMKW